MVSLNIRYNLSPGNGSRFGTFAKTAWKADLAARAVHVPANNLRRCDYYSNAEFINAGKTF